MSLSTLLEAARFLELQELEEKQKQAALDAALSTKSPLINNQSTTIQKSQNYPSTNQQQTVVIATAPNLSMTQSVIHNPATLGAETTEKKGNDNSRHRFINNSFDIINPLYIDEKSNVAKRKPPPLVFRSGTREVHNKLEKHRRAHLKECFDVLKKQLPTSPDEKKTSNLNILHSAIRYIQMLRKKERELEHEMERLAREKISWQTRLALLKKDLSSHYENIDFNRLLSDVVPNEETQTESDEHELSVDVKDEVKIEQFEEDANQHHHHQQQSPIPQNGVKKLSLPILASKCQASTTTVASIKEVQQPVQTTALSVVPVGYPINQGLVLQKLAIVPKGIADLTPLVPTFITQQQINGKVVPLVNAQYVVGKCPLVVVSTPNQRPS